MSNLNSENKYESLTEALKFIFEQQMKGVYTCLPAIVSSYDPTTKRAKVIPAIRRLLTNGEEIALPQLVNVPVCFPTGGGFSLLFPITSGDACLLMFSQRGIENFKQSYNISKPDEGMFDLSDAIAIMGFGPLEVNPAKPDGTSLQSDGGADFVAIEAGKITIETAGTVEVNSAAAIVNAPSTVNGTATVNGDTTINGNLQVSGLLGALGYQSYSGSGPATIDGGLDITNGTVEHDGVNIGKDHVHGGVVVGGGNTGGPQ